LLSIEKPTIILARPLQKWYNSCHATRKFAPPLEKMGWAKSISHSAVLRRFGRCTLYNSCWSYC